MIDLVLWEEKANEMNEMKNDYPKNEGTRVETGKSGDRENRVWLRAFRTSKLSVVEQYIIRARRYTFQ